VQQVPHLPTIYSALSSFCHPNTFGKFCSAEFFIPNDFLQRLIKQLLGK